MSKTAPAKTEIALLEPFEGLPVDRIFVPENADAFADASARIIAAGVVGFDTESKPTFVKGEISTGPHVVQFALDDRAYIFQLHRNECYPFLAAILRSDAVLKVGFGLQSDHALLGKLGVTLRAVLDVSSLFHKLGYTGSTGVRSAVAIVFGRNFRKSKSVTTSNWSQHELTQRQLLYAANDAYAALCVYRELERMADRS